MGSKLKLAGRLQDAESEVDERQEGQAQARGQLRAKAGWGLDTKL